jgi:cellulose synthase/poly-beta-1,6-N-acetylglucosamine synthase-like glycosyltransferase
MCFSYPLFAQNVFQLQTAGEDRELEALLMKQDVYIKYVEDIHVLDEKVTNPDNFQRQRMRWMTAQIQSLTNMLPYIPTAILTGNINYIDKTIQQALIPRSMLLVGLCFFAMLMTLVSPVWSVKWWLLLGCLIVSLIIALPSRMRTHTLFSHVVALPGMVWRMLKNLLHIDRKNTDFLHTTHDEIERFEGLND